MIYLDHVENSNHGQVKPKIMYLSYWPKVHLQCCEKSYMVSKELGKKRKLISVLLFQKVTLLHVLTNSKVSWQGEINPCYKNIIFFIIWEILDQSIQKPKTLPCLRHALVSSLISLHVNFSWTETSLVLLCRHYRNKVHWGPEREGPE